MTFLFWWRTPTPLQLAVRELEASQRELLGTRSHREAYAAHENMLVKRISRLRKEIDEFNQEKRNDEAKSSDD